LIGNGKKHLIPSFQPAGTAGRPSKEELIAQGKTKSKKKTATPAGQPFKTQHTGLPKTPHLKKKSGAPGKRRK